MAMFARLRTSCVLERCLRVTLIKKLEFHVLSPRREGSPHAQTRSFFKLFGATTKSALKKSDDIPDSFTMIYRNTMSNYILGAQIISLVSAGAVLLAMMFKSEYPDYRRKTVPWSPNAPPTKHEEIYYISGFVVVLVAVQMMVARTPIRIYKVPSTSKYIAINYGNYFFGKTRYSFQRGEISLIEEKGILPWKEHRYLIKSETAEKPIILMPHYFRRPADLNIMLGEQSDPELEEEQ